MTNNKKTFSVAVVGATGAVGETMMAILAERDFPIKQLHLLASARSAGKTISFKGKDYSVEDLQQFDFSNVDIALFSAGGSISAEYAPKAAEQGCIVIDNTSHFRREEDIPLVIPEVNPDDIAQYTNRNIIANPNCSTIQMLVALKPIHDAATITRINVCTYQSVSGGGRSAIERLQSHISEGYDEARNLEHEDKPIAFNVWPEIDTFQDNDYTREEMKMVWETQKIFHDDAIAVNPTAVRVPVCYGHSEAVHIETAEKISADEVKRLLKAAPGVELLDKREEFPTALTHGTGTDPVYVGRVREDISHPKGINLWVVADNIRKGAALNSVQIAEHLIQDYLHD